MKVPAFVLKAAVGEFSQEALGSLRALPSRLTEDGYRLRVPELESGLRHVLTGS
jgi:NAD dependent epimerase/dehydratase family enzyme